MIWYNYYISSLSFAQIPVHSALLLCQPQPRQLQKPLLSQPLLEAACRPSQKRSQCLGVKHLMLKEQALSHILYIYDMILCDIILYCIILCYITSYYFWYSFWSVFMIDLERIVAPWRCLRSTAFPPPSRSMILHLNLQTVHLSKHL